MMKMSGTKWTATLNWKAEQTPPNIVEALKMNAVILCYTCSWLEVICLL